EIVTNREYNCSMCKALISKEPELLARITGVRNRAVALEKDLMDTVAEYASMRVSVIKFYDEEYLPRLGCLEERLALLKDTFLGKPQRKHVLKKSGADICAGEPAHDAGTLKSLYRKLARAYHPDTSRRAEEQQFLKNRMAEINDAFSRGDGTALLRYIRRAEAEMGTGSLSSLERLRYLETDITVLNCLRTDYIARIKTFRFSDGYLCMTKVRKMAADGKDFFAEKAMRLESDIKIWKRILAYPRVAPPRKDTVIW
ncbi:MAG: hypothetical protein ABIG11_07010, partial [bacterium]